MMEIIVNDESSPHYWVMALSEALMNIEQRTCDSEARDVLRRLVASEYQRRWLATLEAESHRRAEMN